MVLKTAEDVAACLRQSVSIANVSTDEWYHQQWRNAGDCLQLKRQHKLLFLRNCFMPYPQVQALWENQMELKKQKMY